MFFFHWFLWEVWTLIGVPLVPVSVREMLVLIRGCSIVHCLLSDSELGLHTERAWWWQKSGTRTLQHIHTVTLWDFRPSHYQVQYCWSICTHNTPPEWKPELSHDLRSLPKITNPLCCLWLTTRWDSPIWRRHWRDLLIIHHYCNPLSLSCCFRRKRMSHAIHCLVIHVINRSSMASLAFFLCPRSLCNLILILFLIIGFDKVYESTFQWTDLKLKIIEINPILPTLVRDKQHLILAHAICPFSSLWNLTPRDFHPEEVVTLREHGIQPSWKGTHLENRFDASN